MGLPRSGFFDVTADASLPGLGEIATLGGR